MKKILLALLLIPTLAFSQFNWVKVGDSLKLVNGSHHLFIGGVRLVGENDSNLLFLKPWKIANLYQLKGSYLTAESDPVFIGDSSLFPKKTYLTALNAYNLKKTDTSTTHKVITETMLHNLGYVTSSSFAVGMLSGNSTMESSPSAIPFSATATQWKPANNSAIYGQNISVDYANNKMTISTGYSGLYFVLLMINMN